MASSVCLVTTPEVPPQPQIIYQTVVRPPSNGTSTASVVLGPVSLFFAAFVPIPILGFLLMFIAVPCAVAAAILGHLGLRTSRRLEIGRTPAIIGLVTAYVAIAIIIATTLFWVIAAVSASIRYAS